MKKILRFCVPASAVFLLCVAMTIAAHAQTLRILTDFAYPNGDGPYAALVQATDGNFYGTTAAGGTATSGTVFRITPEGTLTTLHSFTGYPNEGAQPYGGLVQGTDGNFYGTTYNGGASNDGTVFKVTPAGAVTTLFSFSFGGYYGARPYSGLIQASDGNFYGTTPTGGAPNGCCGTVFKIGMS